MSDKDAIGWDHGVSLICPKCGGRNDYFVPELRRALKNGDHVCGWLITPDGSPQDQCLVPLRDLTILGVW